MAVPAPRQGDHQRDESGEEHDHGQLGCTEPRAGGAQQLRVAQPQALATTEPSVDPGQDGEAGKADGSADRRLRKIQERGQTDAPTERGDEQAGQDERQRQDVRKDELALIDQGEGQERPADSSCRPRRGWRQKAEGHDRDGKRAALDERIPATDRSAAVPATAP